MEVVGLLTRLEAARSKGKRKSKNGASTRTRGTEVDIEREWEDVRRQEQSSKEIRKWKQVSLDDFQADLARYVLLALHHLFREVSSQRTDTKDFGGADWSLFSSLQSSETTRIARFPELLDDYISIYKVLKCISMSGSSFTRPIEVNQRIDVNCGTQRHNETEVSFGNVVSVENVRKVLGVDAGNSFGIWEMPLMDNSELLGFAVYPVPSFFNHGTLSFDGLHALRLIRRMMFVRRLHAERAQFGSRPTATVFDQ